MGSTAFESFSSSAALVATAAREFLLYLSGRDASKPFLIALSGGRIAPQFFAAVNEQLPKEGRNELFRNVHFFWADERYVPMESADNTFATSQLHLLKWGVSAESLHPVRTELPLEQAVARASQELSEVAGCGQANPRMDLVILGMGEDGHVASLFPGPENPLELPEAIYYPVVGPKPPPQRVTLSYSMLANAREAWVFASGSGKETALEASLRPGRETPLGRVLGERERTRIFCDFATGSSGRK